MLSESLIQKCCLIANPAAGNPTQYLVEQAFERAGLDWRFMTFEVEPERLGDAMRGIRALGFHGVKVGEPFQATVLEHVDELSSMRLINTRKHGSTEMLTTSKIFPEYFGIDTTKPEEIREFLAKKVIDKEE